MVLHAVYIVGHYFINMNSAEVLGILGKGSNHVCMCMGREHGAVTLHQ